MQPYVTSWDNLDVQQGVKLLCERFADPLMRHSFHDAAEVVRRTFYDRQHNRELMLPALNELPAGRDA
jgi:hypothetical protein